MQMMQNEIDRNYSDNVHTVWFDAWRYEREEYSAMIPLLRTIILSLNNAIANSDDSKKKNILDGIEKQFRKIGGAIIRNTSFNVAGNVGVASGGIQGDIGKMIDDYRSDGSMQYGQKRIYFHEHIADHLKEELKKIRKNDKDNKYTDFKIVIFVDDLDRCTPERALELLESIKSFFDIEGIIYVIGMDPSTIDPIVKTKYGKNSKIDGMSYLQKIVQLPFPIPLWNAPDLSNTIRNMIASTGIPDSDIEKILNETNTKLIINAAQPNPRDIKRFINSIILSRYIYGQSIKDIEKIIAVQAFYFRGGGWLKFLKLLLPYKNRIEFLKDFISLHEKESSERQGLTLEDLKKMRTGHEQGKKSARLDKPVLEIYEKLLELDDEDLLLFLKTSAITLIKIDRFNEYLRVIDETNVTNKRDSHSFAISSEKQLELLKNEKVTEFREYAKEYRKYAKEFMPIHLPFETLKSLDLKNISFKRAFLFKADLSWTDLSRANLEDADLSRANLSYANLSKADIIMANLSGAKLSHAILSEAILGPTNLSGADLSNANFSTANSRDVDLSGADLYMTNFSGTDLAYANLSGCRLRNANLSGAQLQESNLSGANLSGANLSGANLYRSNLSNANLSGARLTKSKLMWANLSMINASSFEYYYADLSEALLEGSNLSGAYLLGATLSGADLSGADLSGARLIRATLSGADLSGADLKNAVLINNKFDNLKVDSDTSFKNAIIDDPAYIRYLREKNVRNIPEEIKYKRDLRSKLEKRFRGFTRENIDKMLKDSRLTVRKRSQISRN
jgi:uncharacterized protein YjbI with pentapeptide repeats